MADARRVLAIGLLLPLLACGTDDGTDDTEPASTGWRSALYPADWTPGLTDADGRFLHDVSFAGYHGGEALPEVDGPIVDVREHGADPSGATDATASIQAAIDAAEDDGGVVWLPSGTYRVDGLLVVEGSFVVIRGDGPEASRLVFTRAEGMSDKAHLTFRGRLSHGPDLALTEDAPSRATTVRVADTTGLAPGVDVAVGWTITEAFVEDHGMTGVWQAFNGTWRPFFRRTVVAVGGDGTVTLDVPLRYDALVRDGASLRVETGHLQEVGLEHVGISTEAEWGAAWSVDRTHAVAMIGVKDAWVRGLGSFDSPVIDDVRGRHLMSGGLKILDAKRVTVADSDLRYAQNRGGGGNGYLYEISRSSEILVRDSAGIGGRHNFIQNWDFGTSGCVWLRTTSQEGRSMISSSSPFGTPGLSEYHHSLAMGNLVDDSLADDGWQAVNRNDFSSGAGHAATQSVFWNLRGAGQLRSFQFGHGYVIGTDGLDVATALDSPDPFGAPEGTAPEDWVEGLEEGAELEPRSLYEDMRARRLGGR